MHSLNALLCDIRNCALCAEHLPLGPRPVLAASRRSRIAIIGQAPGTVVHGSGIPWQDKSGERLREWMDVAESDFYDPDCFALVPMGFCYPGKGKSGDLPPRPECAPRWHGALFDELKELKTLILIGTYAQQYYLKEKRQTNLTLTVKEFRAYLPQYFVLPHPSPRNNIWLKKNAWFEAEVIPALRDHVHSILP